MRRPPRLITMLSSALLLPGIAFTMPAEAGASLATV